MMTMNENMVTDEVLESVTGGNANELCEDLTILESIYGEDYLYNNDLTEDLLVGAYRKLGIEAYLTCDGSTPNQYMINGQSKTQDEIRAYLNV